MSNHVAPNARPNITPRYVITNPDGEYATDAEFAGYVILLNFTSDRDNAQIFDRKTADLICNRYRSLTKKIAPESKNL